MIFDILVTEQSKIEALLSPSLPRRRDPRNLSISEATPLEQWRTPDASPYPIREMKL